MSLLLAVLTSAATAQTAPTVKDVYAVEFLCGSFTSTPSNAEWPVKPGNYSTAINTHNPNGSLIRFYKKAVLTFRGDKPPQPGYSIAAGKALAVEMNQDYAYEIDCADIRSKLLGDPVPAPTFVKGWVIVEVVGLGEPLPLDVSAVYTSDGAENVVRIPPRRAK